MIFQIFNYCMNKKIVFLKLKAIIVFSLCFAFNMMGQIDITDTTALVIAHWKMNESQTYKVSSYNNSTEADKVLSSETINYDLSIKVVDSNQVSYILEWTRSNFEINTENEFDKFIIKMVEDIPFLITTDEFGSSIQVLNWEDVGIEIEKRAEVLKAENKDFPERLKKINRLVRKSSTKELVEENLILDAQQFFAFHGARYKFDERIDLQVKVPNNFGGDPLDANTTMMMDEVNLKQGTFIIRSSQRINPYQLTAVTYDYLSSLNMVGAELPPFEEFPLITKLIWGGSEIHGNSGWVIYSIETKQTNSDKVVTVEERTIELVRKASKE